MRAARITRVALTAGALVLKQRVHHNGELIANAGVPGEMKSDHQIDGTVHVDDAEIYFNLAGDESSPLLLLLHGGIGCTEDFKDLLPALTTQFRVIGIDNRGHGRSTLGSGDLSYGQLEKDTIAVLRHLQIDQTAVLGFSDGGTVGYRLMASPAITVTKLITIGAPWELKPDDPAREIFARVTGQGWREKFPEMYESYQRLNPLPDFDQLVAKTVQMWQGSTETGYLAEDVDCLTGEVLVIRGDNDPFFTREAAVELTSRINQSVFANFAFAGHAAHEDQPEMVLRCILEFLQ